MSTIDGISNTLAGVDVGGGPNIIEHMSTYSVLAYCAAQLDSLDGQITQQTQQQQLALQERQAIEKAQGVFEQFGTQGPQSNADMQTCYNALQQVIQSLPKGDPAAQQVSQFCDTMVQKYDYTPARPLTADEQTRLAQDQAVVNNPNNWGMLGTLEAVSDQQDIQQLQNVSTTGVMAKGPDPNSGDWKGTTDALSSIAGDIKDNSELEMLQLQDLVSKRQTAIQLVTNMMSKMDDTALSVAKNV
jgi:hypothetical protein